MPIQATKMVQFTSGGHNVNIKPWIINFFTYTFVPGAGDINLVPFILLKNPLITG